jgi:phosphoribosyl-AMP cyclohydrolase / phosphoribosyl-ATP pyrophosphohydrolase
MLILKPNFEKRGGLLPVTVQDARTFEILMTASVNEDAWRKTLETGFAHFLTTSRGNVLWFKGESSGNTQQVVAVLLDCDVDALVYLVMPQGAGVACHNNARSCFYWPIQGAALMEVPLLEPNEKLQEIDVDVHRSLLTQDPRPLTRSIIRALEVRLNERAKASPQESYTRQLLDKGVGKCAKKFGEEALEAVIAAVGESDERLIAESADVMYHLLVLLMSRGLSFAAVEVELQRREDKSGLAEKASRKT